MFLLLKNQRGTSLALSTGLVMLLMVSSAAINEVIVKNLRAVHKIEASARAFYAAEGGLEDALYELSPHLPGYETPSILNTPGGQTVRKTQFSASGPKWESPWEIKSVSADTTTSGSLYPFQKSAISFYKDSGVNNVIATANHINENGHTVVPLDFNLSGPPVTFTFTINQDLGAGGLVIDNDRDGVLNEDSRYQGPGTCTDSTTKDNDCDGREDEDSEYDPVLYWVLSDGSGHTLFPKKGCLTDLAEDPTDPLTPPHGSQICEKDFACVVGGTCSVTFSFNNAKGIDETGQPLFISDFLQAVTDDPLNPDDAKIQMEISIIAPMEKFSPGGNSPIQKIDYSVVSTLTGPDQKIANPAFTINSDGYFQDFKQSLKTVLTPQTTAPLLEFTIIQQ